MKSLCEVCGASFRGIPLNTIKDGKKVEACPTCYKTLDEVYRKNSCLTCVFFNIDSCELFSTELEEPYLQKLKCEYFTDEPDPTKVSKARIKKYEMAGKFEAAAEEYEKIGMTEKAQEARKKIEKKAAPKMDINVLLEQMSSRGQILTYYCCHCGSQLKIGGSYEILSTCPKCKLDLNVIDIAKLINQHI